MQQIVYIFHYERGAFFVVGVKKYFEGMLHILRHWIIYQRKKQGNTSFTSRGILQVHVDLKRKERGSTFPRDSREREIHAIPGKISEISFGEEREDPGLEENRARMISATGDSRVENTRAASARRRRGLNRESRIASRGGRIASSEIQSINT